MVASAFVSVTMAIFVEASRIVPVNSKSFLNSEGDSNKRDPKWQTAQHASSALTVSAEDLSISPGFVSKIVKDENVDEL